MYCLDIYNNAFKWVLLVVPAISFPQNPTSRVETRTYRALAYELTCVPALEGITGQGVKEKARGCPFLTPVEEAESGHLCRDGATVILINSAAV